MDITLYSKFFSEFTFSSPTISFPLFIGYDGFNHINSDKLTYYSIDSNLDLFDDSGSPLDPDLAFNVRWHLHTVFYSVYRFTGSYPAFRSAISLLFFDPDHFYKRFPDSVFSYGFFYGS